ncbi:MAG: 3-keto-5-aminohexanoate cleavage protein, partial [Bacteroidota bacterium]
PKGSFWQSIVISRKQWKLSALAAVMGGNIRVGLEDNFYLPNGEMAKSNGDLVDHAVELVRLIGREPATIEETRSFLNIHRKS